MRRVVFVRSDRVQARGPADRSWSHVERGDGRSDGRGGVWPGSGRGGGSRTLVAPVRRRQVDWKRRQLYRRRRRRR